MHEGATICAHPARSLRRYVFWYKNYPQEYGSPTMTLLASFYIKCALIGFAGAAAIGCVIAAGAQILSASGF